MCKISSFAGISYCYMALSCQRFKHHKQVNNTISAIFIVNLFNFTRLYWQRRSAFFDKLTICFIKAYNRPHFIIRILINIKYIFHCRYEFRSGFWDTPFFNKPWFKFIFFKAVPTAVDDIESITLSSTSLSAIICNVQRL